MMAMRGIKQRPHSLIAAVFAALASLLPCPAPAAEEFHNFQNNEGKTVRAAVVAVNDDSVTLKMESGKLIQAKIDIFSPLDQDYISKFPSSQPAATSRFKARVSASRKDRNEREEGVVKVSYEAWCYKVELESSSQEELSDVVAEYRVYKLRADVDADAARDRNSKLKSSGDFAYLEGNYQIGQLPRMGKTTFETDSVPIIKSALKPGWSYNSGRDDKNKDELKGIWLRLKQGGKVIFEHKTIKAPVNW